MTLGIAASRSTSAPSRLREPAGREVADEERDADRERHGDEDCDRRGQDGPEGEGPDVVQEGSRRSGSSSALAVRAGHRLDEEEDRDAREDGQYQDPGPRDQGREDAVTRPAKGWADASSMLVASNRQRVVDLSSRAIASTAGWIFARVASLSGADPAACGTPPAGRPR